MPEITIKPSQGQVNERQLKGGANTITLGMQSPWLDALQQEKKDQQAGQSLAELAKQREAEAAKKQEAAQTGTSLQAQYTAGQATSLIKSASSQAANTYSAIEQIGKAERDSRDPLKQLGNALGGLMNIRNIMNGDFKPDSVLGSVLGGMNDPKQLIEAYKAAFPGKRAFNADHVKAVLAETNLMLQSAGDLVKGIDANTTTAATSKAGELAQRFLNVTDKLALALKNKQPFPNKDYAEMLRITAELRECGLAPADSLMNSKSMDVLNRLVNAKGEPNSEIKAMMTSGKISVETRDQMQASLDKIKTLDPKKDQTARTTELIKLYAAVLANKTED